MRRYIFFLAMFPIALLDFVTEPAHADRRVALVVGNGAYQNAPSLPNPRNDAQDVGASLRRAGFETIIGLDLDQKGMQDTAIKFSRAARTADVAIFYYSGHAIQYAGVNYLAPIDAKLNDEADLRRLVKVDEVVADLQQAKNLRILVLDSCRDNPLAEQLKRSIGVTRAMAVQRGLAKIDSPQGMIVAYATQAGRTADDGNGRNSPYTAAFLKRIDENEEIGTVFRRVSADVYETTKHEQLPELSLSLIGEFYLHGRLDVTVATPSSDSCNAASDHWRSAEAIGTIAAFEDHLARFSNCAFAGLARAKLDTLKSKALGGSTAALTPAKIPISPNRCRETATTVSLPDNCVIKIGNIMPYSGPAAEYGMIGKTEEAYFKKVNAEGGINGRRINFISYDDGYSPPRTVEDARKLVEQDEVLLIFNPLGTPGNSSIQRYLNDKKVPQLLVASGSSKWGDPKSFPWTMGWQPTYQTEGRVYAKYILANKPDAKIAVLYQNDDYGRDYVKGLKDGLGYKASGMIVAEEAYAVSEPSIASRVVTLKGAGADVFVDIATPKFAAQAIKAMAEIGWSPMHILNNVSASIGGVMKPAGFENSQGIISTAYMKDPTDPRWINDSDMKEWVTFMDKYIPGGSKTDGRNVYGYSVARTLVQILKQCGDDLTRENVMKQAANLRGFEPGLLLPGIKINTSPTDFFPLEQLQLMRFQGHSWELFGPVITAEIGG
jgi:branched-chain amino acid transport system substrate-binding protein